MSNDAPCLESCCDTIEVSSSYTSLAGTYTKQSATQDGRVAYGNSDSSKFMYWSSGWLGWVIGSSLGSPSVSVKHVACNGVDGFCPTGCNSTWEVSTGQWGVDSSFTVTCVGEHDPTCPDPTAETTTAAPPPPPTTPPPTTPTTTKKTTKAPATCKNKQSNKKCAKMQKKKKCSKKFWKAQCALTCKKCCGNIWGTNKCKKNQRNCKKKGRKGKNVRANCRKQCKKCK